MFAVCWIKNFDAKLFHQYNLCNRAKRISFVTNIESACYRVVTTVLQGCNIYQNVDFFDKKIRQPITKYNKID